MLQFADIGEFGTCLNICSFHHSIRASSNHLFFEMTVMMMNATHPTLQSSLLVEKAADQILNFDGSQVLCCHRLRPRLLNDALNK